MRFANPAGLWLALLVIPIIILHVLKPRRQRVSVSSVFLWDEAPRPVSAAVPWHRLRPSWLLLAQILAALLLAGLVANPIRSTDAILADHTVFIVDASGSMAASDGDPDRLADALSIARDLRGQMPDGAIASVVEAGPRSRVLLSASPDELAFERALDSIEVNPAAADFADAFLLAESLETPGVPIGFALLSDGGLTLAEQRLLPLDTVYHQVGRSSTNRAASGLVVEPSGSGLRVIATVTNHGSQRVSQPVRLDVDGLTVADTVLDIAANEVATWELETTAGDRVDLFLESEDLLDADDHAYAVAARRRELTVSVVGTPDPFLERALAVIPSLTLETGPTLDPAVDPDLIIYNGVDPPADPPAPFIAIASPGGAPGITVGEEITGPAVTLVDTNNSLLSNLDLSDVVIATAQQIVTTEGRVLVAAPGAPLLVESTSGRRPFLYLSFSLGDTNLPLQIAFPILIDRMVGQLAGGSLPPTGLEVGNQIPLSPTEVSTIIAPAGQEITIPPGTPSPRIERTGFWRLIDGEGNETTIAVNSPASESKVDPVPGLPTELRVIEPGEKRPRGEESVREWLLWPLLAVVAAEFLLARRRVGVTTKQWRVAVGARVAVVGLLIAALLGATIHRSAGDVATVFLIDASDSVTTGGRADSVDWVQDALAAQPDGARSAIALFGADARLELTLQGDNVLGVPAVQIDGSETDAERALRLAGAVLPTDARRRIVILSDGRFTVGDNDLEAALLGQGGVQIDVVPVGRAAGLDVAVAGVSSLGTVRVGESYAIEATIAASEPATVLVSLLVGAEVVEERALEVDAGLTTVQFEREATEAELARYQVRVSAAGDAIVQNDAAFGAVRVEGPPTVLLVEGTTGEGAVLANALEAGGITVETTSPAVIPPLDELSTFSAIVLVDVDERDFTDTQIELLSQATRDLGRGLVVLGGDRSYGLGGYLDSELEELLPVVSEILDPERRQTVAEVLAIDTSGSMGNCHCNEEAQPGIGGVRNDGGSNKTDISRAGAARAIEALNENDEVGVLAFNSREQWVIDLQKLPSEDVVNSGLAGLFPSGGTNAKTTLTTAAAALRESNASLKHIIFFSDGFTNLGDLATLADEAAELAAEGITVSVIATGEGAAGELEAIAVNGQGRFYPGRDLQQIPELIMEEAVIASRDFITEGEFFPEITSSSEVIDNLATSPPLLGYVGTTEKPTARTLLRIGPDRDPLLTTWQVGIGQATAWSSDAGQRWSQLWADWDGYVDFWTRTVKDTFPAGDGAGAITARVTEDRIELELEGAETFPDGATAIARITGPDGSTIEVPLQRTGGSRFEAEVTVDQTGTFAVGAAVSASGESLLSVSTLASSSFAAEYLPGDPDPEALLRLSDLSGGRGAIEPSQAFDTADLAAGISEVDLAPLFLLLAAILWPLALALSRLSLRTAAVTTRVQSAGRGFVDRFPSRPGRPERSPKSPAPEKPKAPASPPTTVDQLLRKKRGDPEQDPES